MTYQCPVCFDTGSVCDACFARLPIEGRDNVFFGAEAGKQITSGTDNYGLRAPIAPGVQIDDPDPLGVYVAPVVLRLAGRWVGAIAMVVGAVSIMYAEGQRQPAPGVGFGIALALLMGAALLLPLGRSNDG